MEAVHTLTSEQLAKLEEAKDKITLQMMESLEHGEEIELNDTFTLYHYTEEDVFVLVTSEEWQEVFQVMTEEEKIIFESL